MTREESVDLVVTIIKAAIRGAMEGSTYEERQTILAETFKYVRENLDDFEMTLEK